MSEYRNSSKKSLEEIYKEKLASKKINAPKSNDKYEAKLTKERKKVAQKNISVPKRKEKQDESNEIRVGNLIIEKDALNQAYYINKREKSRALIITTLSVLIALVIFISGVVIYFNLSKQVNGELVVSGNGGVVWVVENEEMDKFYLPSELREGARVQIKIDLKKITDEVINSISIRVRAYKDMTEINNLLVDYNTYSETNLNGFAYNAETKTYTKSTWDAENGTILNFSTSFLIGNDVSGINVTNFKIIFTVITG